MSRSSLSVRLSVHLSICHSVSLSPTSSDSESNYFSISPFPTTINHSSGREVVTQTLSLSLKFQSSFWNGPRTDETRHSVLSSVSKGEGGVARPLVATFPPAERHAIMTATTFLLRLLFLVSHTHSYFLFLSVKGRKNRIQRGSFPRDSNQKMSKRHVFEDFRNRKGRKAIRRAFTGSSMQTCVGKPPLPRFAGSSGRQNPTLGLACSAKCSLKNHVVYSK